MCLDVVVLGLRVGTRIIPLRQEEELESHLACGQRDEDADDDCEEDDDDDVDIDRFNSSLAAGTLARSNMISIFSCCCAFNMDRNDSIVMVSLSLSSSLASYGVTKPSRLGIMT